MRFSVYITAHTAGRENNFNLLRFGAAVSVVLSHSILLTGDLDNALAWRIGYLAVNCFFVISGFLVCGSLLRRQPGRAFLEARLLRIYPALVTVMLLTVIVLGPALTLESTADYLGSPQTWHYLVTNSLLVVGEIALYLPGVFPDTPLPGQVNAPLWTLQFELVMYGALFVLAILSRWIDKSRDEKCFAAMIIIITVLCTAGYLLNVTRDAPATDLLANLLRFGAMFGAGASYYLLRNKIRLSWFVAVAIVVAAALSSESRWLFMGVTYLGLPYVLLCLAYLLRGPILGFNRLGDYSYGTYIIAFPIQQTVVSLSPGISPFNHFIITLGVTLPLAALSWHLVERPALKLKH